MHPLELPVTIDWFWLFGKRVSVKHLACDRLLGRHVVEQGDIPLVSRR